MPADRDDDDTPSDEPKSSRGPKKRFQERDDKEDEDDDRPRKKRSRDDADDDDAPKKRRADGEEEDAPKKRRSYDEDDPPKKRRRANDGPRLKSNDNIPIVMLLAFIGSALALLVICAGCGWWSFDWLVGGGEGFAGGGHEFEVTYASRTPGVGAFGAPQFNWAVTQKQNTSSGAGQYYLIIKSGTAAPVVKQIYPNGKGWSQSGGGQEMGLRGTTGKTEVWVEKRPNPVATGKVVSNVYVIP